MSAQQKIEARLSQLINTGDIPSLVQTCEEAELKYYQDANARPSPFFYSSWLLSLLIQNDLENARFLWKRIHKDTKKNSNELKAVWKIGQGMWNRDPAAVYQALTTYSWDTSLVPLVNVLAGTKSFSSTSSSWSCSYAALVVTCTNATTTCVRSTETYRHRMFTLVAKGYTNISLNDTANFLGMDPATTKTCKCLLFVKIAIEEDTLVVLYRTNQTKAKANSAYTSFF
eukprot:GEZU01021432.1.p1 GENE.GEZU01021432.1~~GEZU01021432.1.p1  ORF type:complete len:228 (-),score=35.12 GEZU01021432.1:231-914(-)